MNDDTYHRRGQAASVRSRLRGAALVRRDLVAGLVDCLDPDRETDLADLVADVADRLPLAVVRRLNRELRALARRDEPEPIGPAYTLGPADDDADPDDPDDPDDDDGAPGGGP